MAATASSTGRFTLWPVYRRVLPDGDELTLRNELEHQLVNQAAVTLDRLGPDMPEGAAALQSMTRLLDQDVRDEEEVLLPRLQQALTERSCTGWAGPGAWSVGSRRPGRTQWCPGGRRAT